ncbi:MAG: lactamase [Peptococcaceae bacterium BRH_c4b]|nr:MAG: lactamase [Peptococcaceae bacterium BRH_c4b]
MKAINIKEGVYWVGARDPELRVFDIVMETVYGTTYNAYLVVGEKVALIDTVKERCYEQLVEKISEIVPVAEIDYIIANHTEPDHSGSLARLLKETPKAQVLGSKPALMFLKEIVNFDFNQRVVAHGEELDLGGKTLKFISAPFLHWPDSMFTYLKEDKLLCPCDAFGCHYCSEEMFNDLVADDMSDAFKYYFDVIVSPFRNYVLEAAEKIKDLEIDIIAPSHGPILRQDPWSYVEKYAGWSRREEDLTRQKSVPVIYTSAYGNTARLAGKIAQGLEESGVKTELLELGKVTDAEIIARIEAAPGFLIGSPTINRDAVPPVWYLLALVSAITNKGKPAAAFGSYGWSGEAVKLIEQRLSGLQLKVGLPGLRVNFVPTEKSLDEAREFGKSFAGVIKGENS